MKVKIIGIPQAKDGVMLPTGFQGLEVENGDIDMVSSKTGKLGGNYHSNDGTQIQYNNIPVEAEKLESFHVDPRDGAGIVGGNLSVLGGKIKFKDAFLKLGKAEAKVDKLKNRATYLSKSANPLDKYDKPKLGTAKIYMDAINQKSKAIEETKNYLTDMQNHILDTAKSMDKDPKEVSKMLSSTAKYGKRMAKGGDSIDPNTLSEQQQLMKDKDYNEALDEYAKTSGIPRLGKAGRFDDGLGGPRTNYVKNYINKKHIADQEAGPIIPIPLPDWNSLAKLNPQEELNVPLDKNPNVELKPMATTNKPPSGKNAKGLREKLGISDILPEISTIFDRPDPVPMEQYNPNLMTPYSVSFDDRIAANQGDFNAEQKLLARNPAALGALNAQKYNIDNQTKAEEFRTNQGIANNIANQNVGIINQAKQINTQLQEKRDQEQAMARANTIDNRFRAEESISNKLGQIRRDNGSIARYEALEHYVWDPHTQQYVYNGPEYNPLHKTVGVEDPTHPSKGKVKYTKNSDGSYSEVDESADETAPKSYYGGNMMGGGSMGGGMQAPIATRYGATDVKKRKSKKRKYV